MLGDKILAGESSDKPEQNFVIGGDVSSSPNIPAQKKSTALSLAERITLSTEQGGLNELPEDFDDEKGDWKIINASNPFENLYLDYKQYKFITPEIVSKNYTLLEKFWKQKFAIMNTGGNRIAFKSKYGDGTVENALINCKRAYDKINTTEGIQRYFTEINNERLQKGAENLRDNIEQMMRDGSADKAEIIFCFEKGIKYDLNDEEIAAIISKKLTDAGFKPYGTVTGNSASEKLLSVDSWMTAAKITEAETLKKERQSLRIQILPGKYASNITEIGTILFNDPTEAKAIIKEDLLKQAIAQKDIVLAREIGNISNNSKDINAAFFQIVYKLNNTLPFPFINQQSAKNIYELASLIFQNEQTLKAGKESLSKGYIEAWLRETDKLAHARLIYIRDSAENLDQAFLAMLYSFNPSLPYRFAGNILIKNTVELCNEINRNVNNWNAGKIELYNGFITTWLQNTGKADLVNQWNKVKQNAGSQDIGLEDFLHILNEKIESPVIKASISRIDYPKIQSGKLIETEIQLNLSNRGYAEVMFSFSKNLPGVTLSAAKIDFNIPANIANKTVTLSIDSSQLLKGVDYNTSVLIHTSAEQLIEIPVSFKIIFPKNAFILETVKYSVIFSAFFIFIRFILSSTHHGWLNMDYNFFLNADEAFNYTSAFSLFGWTFFLFLVCFSTAMYFLTKYLYKK